MNHYFDSFRFKRSSTINAVLPGLLIGVVLACSVELVNGQTYASIAGVYSGTEDSHQTLTYAGTTESLDDSYKLSDVQLQQSGNTFSYTVKTPGGSASPYTRTGILDGNRIVSLSGPVIVALDPGLRVTRNEITSVTGIVSNGKIVMQMNGVAEGTFQGLPGRFDVQSSVVLYGPAVPVPDFSILTPPASKSVLVGDTVIFSVVASVAGLNYQWRKDGVNLVDGQRLTGATRATVTLLDAHPADAGTYSVVVSNSSGSALTRDATLVVHALPQITRQPQNVSVVVGSAAQFVVQAIGTEPLVYQWRFNGANLDGATNTYYAIASVQTNHSGQYSVAVGNLYGSLISSNAILVAMPFVPFHFEPVVKVDGVYQARVRAAEEQIVVVDISTNLINWFPFQTNRIGSDPFVVPIISNQPQIFLRARTASSGSTNPPANAITPTGMVWIPPGTFTMGSPLTEKDRSSDEAPQMQVTISQGFWMSKYETTQAEYRSVMGENPSTFKGDDTRPVESGSWQDATNYCAKITAIERSSGRLPMGYEYRLPTEAEWEYACRAVTTTATAFGDKLSSTQANFNGRYPYGGAAEGPYYGSSTPVGSYAPNPWGLYDIHGNVDEWCLDWLGAYPGGNVTDPRGAITGLFRVCRGGSCYDHGPECRSASRDARSPNIPGYGIGIRPVLAVAQ